MNVRRFARCMSLMMVVMSLLTVPMSTGPVQARSDADDAAEAAVELSELESKGRASSLYRHLHSDAKAIVPESAVVGWYENDFFPLEPQPISEIVSVMFVDWTWDVTGETYRHTAEVSYVQPFGSGANVTYQQETVRLVEEEGEWRWFFGRSPEFVNEQIARFPGEDSRSSSRSNNSDSSSQRNSSRARDRDGAISKEPRAKRCTAVQLYPGYPGYRGNITGVMPHWGGQGDYECLEVLEARDPRFNRSREDRANKQAAEELGIAGSMDVWTWENWMQIEAVRGLQPSCYSCLMFDETSEPINVGLHSDAGDIRVFSGLAGQTLAIDKILTGLFGHTSVPYIDTHTLNDDYVLRATVYQFDPTMNAEELYRAMEEWINRITGASTGYAAIDPYASLGMAIWERGGYVWVADNASAFDQYVLMYYSVAVATIYLGGENGNMALWEFEANVDQWTDSGYSVPLDSFMQGKPYWSSYQPSS